MVGDEGRLTWHHLDTLGMIEQALVLVGAILLDNLIFLGDQVRPTDWHLHRGQTRIPGMGRVVDQPRRLDQILGG